MFTMEQLEKTKKHYEKVIAEAKLKLQENFDDRDIFTVRHEIRLNIYRPGELRMENNHYPKHMELIDQHIRINMRLIEDNERELEVLNKMIDELKNEHSE